MEPGLIEKAETYAIACDYISATCATCAGNGTDRALSECPSCKGVGEMWGRRGSADGFLDTYEFIRRFEAGFI